MALSHPYLQRPSGVLNAPCSLTRQTSATGQSLSSGQELHAVTDIISCPMLDYLQNPASSTQTLLAMESWTLTPLSISVLFLGPTLIIQMIVSNYD